jgi:hypothetical protein
MLGSKNNPAHAHLKTTDKIYLGKFAITQNAPRNFRYVFDCDKKKSIPTEYKKIIVEWAKKKSKRGVNNWLRLDDMWEALHEEE